MKRISNLETANIFLLMIFIVLGVFLATLLILDVSNLFYGAFPLAENMQLENWTSLIGAIIGVFGTVSITMFFHNKNEILKEQESLVKRWDRLSLFKHIYLESKNLDFINKSNNAKFAIKYNMSATTKAELYNDEEQYNLLCDLLLRKNRKSSDMDILPMYLGENINSKIGSIYYDDLNLLLVDKGFDFLYFGDKITNIESDLDTFNRVNNYNIFLIRLSNFIKEIYQAKFLEDNYKCLTLQKICEKTDEYLNNEEYKKYFSNFERTEKNENVCIKIYIAQREILDMTTKWAYRYNLIFTKQIKKAEIQSNYELIHCLYKVLKIYEYFVNNNNFAITDLSELPQTYDIQFIEGNSLNAGSDFDAILIIDRKLIENIELIHKVIENIITNASIYELITRRISKYLAKKRQNML